LGLREPLTIHFGEQTNLFVSGHCHAKSALASTKADLPSLPESKNLLFVTQKQSLELPLKQLLKGLLERQALKGLFYWIAHKSVKS